MAIKVQQVTVIDDSKNITNVQNVSAVNATFSGTDAIKLPSGTSSQRPSGSESQFRYNNETKSIEYFDGTEWKTPGSAAGRIYFAGSL